MPDCDCAVDAPRPKFEAPKLLLVAGFCAAEVVAKRPGPLVQVGADCVPPSILDPEGADVPVPGGGLAVVLPNNPGPPDEVVVAVFMKENEGAAVGAALAALVAAPNIFADRASVVELGSKIDLRFADGSAAAGTVVSRLRLPKRLLLPAGLPRLPKADIANQSTSEAGQCCFHSTTFHGIHDSAINPKYQ